MNPASLSMVAWSSPLPFCYKEERGPSQAELKEERLNLLHVGRWCALLSLSLLTLRPVKVQKIVFTCVLLSFFTRN